MKVKRNLTVWNIVWPTERSNIHTVYSITNFGIIPIRQKTENKGHRSFTGGGASRPKKKGILRGKDTERTTAGCKRAISPVSQDGLDLVLSPEKKKNAPAPLTPSKPNWPKFRGAQLSATFQRQEQRNFCEPAFELN